MKGVYFLGVMAIGFGFAVGLTLISLVVMVFDASRRGVGKELLKKIWSWGWYFKGKATENTRARAK